MEIEILKGKIQEKIKKLNNKKISYEKEYNATIAEKNTAEANIYEIEYKTKMFDAKNNFLEILIFILGILTVIVSLPIVYNVTKMSLFLINIIGVFEIIGVSLIPGIISSKTIENKKKNFISENGFDYNISKEKVKYYICEIERKKEKIKTLEIGINEIDNSIQYLNNILDALENFLFDSCIKEENKKIKTDLVFNRKLVKKNHIN